jgi:hypothetical protein
MGTTWWWYRGDANNGRGNTVETVMATAVIIAVTVLFYQHIFSERQFSFFMSQIQATNLI